KAEEESPFITADAEPASLPDVAGEMPPADTALADADGPDPEGQPQPAQSPGEALMAMLRTPNDRDAAGRDAPPQSGDKNGATPAEAFAAGKTGAGMRDA